MIRTVHLDGSVTCGHATLAYTIKKQGRTLASESGLTSVPGKKVDVTGDDVQPEGDYELTLTASSGVVRIGRIGLIVDCTDGAPRKVYDEHIPAAILGMDGKDSATFVLKIMPADGPGQP